MIDLKKMNKIGFNDKIYDNIKSDKELDEFIEIIEKKVLENYKFYELNKSIETLNNNIKVKDKSIETLENDNETLNKIIIQLNNQITNLGFKNFNEFVNSYNNLKLKNEIKKDIKVVNKEIKKSNEKIEYKKYNKYFITTIILFLIIISLFLYFKKSDEIKEVLIENKIIEKEILKESKVEKLILDNEFVIDYKNTKEIFIECKIENEIKELKIKANKVNLKIKDEKVKFLFKNDNDLLYDCYVK